MNVLLCSESHFVQVGENVYCPQTPPDYFQRYRQGWEEVIILGRLALSSEPPPGAPLLNLEGIRMVGLPDYRGPLQYIWRRRHIRNIARDLLRQVDSVIFRGAHQISAVVYSLIRGTGRPYGIEVVGDPFDSLAPGATNLPFRSYFRRRFVHILKRLCYNAYAASYVTANALQARYPTAPGRYSTHFSDVVTNPVEHPRQDFPATGPYRLISIGTMATMYKGFDVLLRAVAQAANAGLDLHLVIIGDGMHMPELQRLAYDLQIGNHVNFRGLVPFGDAVNAEIDQSHLLAMPSRQEGLPRAMVEAMARALPCIGSAVGGIPELLSNDELFPPNDPPALAAKLLEMLPDTPRMLKLSKRNLQVAAQYSEEVLRKRRIEFYYQLRAGTDAWQSRQMSDSASKDVERHRSSVRTEKLASSQARGLPQ
jgi:glycosyltransferase involved in cell wall biosynthesis